MSESQPQLPEQEKSIPRVFVVHGNTEEMKDIVVAYLSKLGIQSVLTQDKVNGLKPIAQKVHEHQNISFAIVVLSGDDFVYPKESKAGNALLKANQKVVFELGFWVSRLGRDHVVAIYQDQKSFRRPTEYFDVLYFPLDKQKFWQKELATRLKQAGFTINP